MSGNSTERRHDSTHQVQTLLERFENRITLANPRFIERYIKSEINILVDFRVRGIDQQYIACFQREHFESGSDVDILSDSKNEVLPIPQQKRIASVTNVCPVLVGIESSERRAGSNEQTMFIDSIQLMEFPEGFIPSFMRLEVRDDLLSRWRHVTYSSSKEFGLIDLGRVKDGKSCLARGVWSKRANQVIESGSQMLQSVPSDQHDLTRNFGDMSHVVDHLSGIRVLLASEYVGVGVLEPYERIFEILDVLVGPFDFGFAPLILSDIP